MRETLTRVPAHVSRDDLTSAGLAALAQAARAYDADRGAGFVAYASTRIRGAVVDELRGMDWASRSVRRRARSVDEVRGTLSTELGRPPTDAEVAAALGMGLDQLKAHRDDVSRASVLSLQGFDDSTIDDVLPVRGETPRTCWSTGSGSPTCATPSSGCPSVCGRSSRATSSRSGRWPSSPRSSGSPSRGSPSSGPRRSRC